MWGGKANHAGADEMSAAASAASGVVSQPQTSPPRPHSRFIPEAQRGWHVPTAEVQQSAIASMRRSSSGAGGTNGANGGSTYSMSSLLEIRRATWGQLASRWNGPRLATRKDQSRPASTALTDDEDLQRTSDDDDDDEAIEEQDEEDDDDGSLLRAHTRERSSSVPDLSLIDRPANDKDTYRARHRKQTPHSPRPDEQPILADGRVAPPLYIDVRHTNSRGSLNHIHYDHLLTPAQLTRQNSITPSLELQRSPSQLQPRGYEWRPYAGSKKHSGHVPPSHRNPTAMQAFYDSHFGSSSGFRSVAGLADDFFHPLGSAKHVLSRLNVVNSSKDKKAAQRSSVSSSGTPNESQARDSLMSWRTMPFTPAIFGMGASPSSMPTQQQQQTQMKKATAAAASSHHQTTTSGAYEPELIPTVHRDPRAHRYFKQLEGNVVLLGGYRGSILRDAATHQMVWVPLKVGVGLRRPTLELGLSDAAEAHSEDLIVADEMLSGVGNMVDTGRRLIARCTSKRTKVHSWGFDWRLSLGRSSVRLEAFLQQLWNDSADRDEDRRGAKVVAHSMGGLVALHALAQTSNPRIFESLVFASTPFLGTANILGPFAFGDAALWNDEICSPRATFSFRSSFYLLPSDPLKRGALDTKGGRCFEEEDGTPHDVDFLDPQTWDDLGLSPCVKRGARRKVLQAAEDKARQQKTTVGYQLEHSASQQSSLEATQSIDRSDPAKEKATRVPVFPGADMQMQGPEKDEEGVTEAVKKVQSLAGRRGDTDETLQPANRQREEAVQPKSESKEVMAKVKGDDDEESVSWSYLENTLAETRQFYHELRTSFKPEWHAQGLYPPIALLTSGRTPTVRGALVWPRGSEALAKQEARVAVNSAEGEESTGAAAAGSSAAKDDKDRPSPAADAPADDVTDHWKRTARLCDYSRMLYAPGDGVILRRSATTLPGGWSTLLVKGAASADERGLHALTSDEGVVETSHRHVTLLSDVDGVGRCLEACRRARVNRWPQSAQVISSREGKRT